MIQGGRGHADGGLRAGLAGGAVGHGDRLLTGGGQLHAVAEGLDTSVSNEEGVVSRQDGGPLHVGGAEVDLADESGVDVVVHIVGGHGG